MLTSQAEDSEQDGGFSDPVQGGGRAQGRAATGKWTNLVTKYNHYNMYYLKRPSFNCLIHFFKRKGL